MGAIVAFFTGPLGKIGLYAIGILAAVGLLAGVYLSWKNSVTTAALAEFNKKQLEQVVKDQQAFIEKQQQLNDLQTAIVDQLNKQNEALEAKFSSVEKYLDSEAAKKADRPASDVLKETIKELSK